MSKIYLVMGQTGEYGDAHEWAVKAFHREDDAIELTELLTSKMKEAVQSVGGGWSSLYNPGGINSPVEGQIALVQEVKDELIAEIQKFDPRFHFDYTGTIYFHVTVPAKLRN